MPHTTGLNRLRGTTLTPKFDQTTRPSTMGARPFFRPLSRICGFVGGLRLPITWRYLDLRNEICQWNLDLSITIACVRAPAHPLGSKAGPNYSWDPTGRAMECPTAPALNCQIALGRWGKRSAPELPHKHCSDDEQRLRLQVSSQSYSFANGNTLKVPLETLEPKPRLSARCQLTPTSPQFLPKSLFP